MNGDTDKNGGEKAKPSVTLPGTVEKIIKPLDSEEPEKVQIAIDGADDLYKEIRIENTLQDHNGDAVELKLNASVDVTVEADAADTKPKAKTQGS